MTAALLHAAPSSASHDGDPSVFDCAGDPPGMLQSINGSTTAGNYTMFKRLDIATGDYVSAGTSNLVWGDLILLGSGREMNATATDPTTGKSFGRLSADGAGPVLVQFDMDGHARFVGRLPGNDTWAAVVTSGGDYVFSVRTSQGLGVVADVSSLQTFPLSTDEATLPMLGTIVESTPNDPPGDITLIESGGVEYIIGYDHTTDQFMAYGSDLTQPPIAFTNTILPPEFSTFDDVLGAAWTVDGNAYFSRNDGGGVFVVDGDSFDPSTLTAVASATSITTTDTTNSNDGFGCASAAAGQVPATTTTSTTTTTAAPTTTAPQPVVSPPTSGPAEPVAEAPTFTG